jgi:hypothetical protein
MKQTQTIPETFLGVGYTKDRTGAAGSAGLLSGSTAP